MFWTNVREGFFLLADWRFIAVAFALAMLRVGMAVPVVLSAQARNIVVRVVCTISASLAAMTVNLIAAYVAVVFLLPLIFGIEQISPEELVKFLPTTPGYLIGAALLFVVPSFIPNLKTKDVPGLDHLLSLAIMLHMTAGGLVKAGLVKEIPSLLSGVWSIAGFFLATFASLLLLSILLVQVAKMLKPDLNPGETAWEWAMAVFGGAVSAAAFCMYAAYLRGAAAISTMPVPVEASAGGWAFAILAAKTLVVSLLVLWKIAFLSGGAVFLLEGFFIKKWRRKYADTLFFKIVDIAVVTSAIVMGGAFYVMSLKRVFISWLQIPLVEVSAYVYSTATASVTVTVILGILLIKSLRFGW